MGARWQVVRSATPGLLRRPGSEGAIVISAVDPGHELAWHDPGQGFEAVVRLVAANGTTAAEIMLEAPWWRIPVEGLRNLPARAVVRLGALCQTAASL